MTASNEAVYFPVWPLPETAMGLMCNCLVGAVPYTLHDPIIPSARSQGFPPRTNDLTRPLVAAIAAP